MYFFTKRKKITYSLGYQLRYPREIWWVGKLREGLIFDGLCLTRDGTLEIHTQGLSEIINPTNLIDCFSKCFFVHDENVTSVLRNVAIPPHTTEVHSCTEHSFVIANANTLRGGLLLTRSDINTYLC